MWAKKIIGEYANKNGIKKIPIDNRNDLYPVNIGSPSLIAAAVYAHKHTGGVNPEVWLNQKIIIWATNIGTPNFTKAGEAKIAISKYALVTGKPIPNR
ncbi:hypothetical protein ES705_34028 [subsurface metagenome]